MSTNLSIKVASHNKCSQHKNYNILSWLADKELRLLVLQGSSSPIHESIDLSWLSRYCWGVNDILGRFAAPFLVTGKYFYKGYGGWKLTGMTE